MLIAPAVLGSSAVSAVKTLSSVRTVYPVRSARAVCHVRSVSSVILATLSAGPCTQKDAQTAPGTMVVSNAPLVSIALLALIARTVACVWASESARMPIMYGSLISFSIDVMLSSKERRYTWGHHQGLRTSHHPRVRKPTPCWAFTGLWKGPCTKPFNRVVLSEERPKKENFFD